MGETTFQTQFRQLTELMLSPLGVAGLLGLLALMVGALVSQRLRWLIMPFLLWISTMGFLLVTEGHRVVVLASPLNEIRAYGRPICMALLLALFVPALASSRGWRWRPVGAAVVAFFIFEMILAFRIAVGLEAARGIASLMIYPLIFVVLGVGVGRWLQDWSDARTAVRCIVGAALLFLLSTIYQLLISPSSIAVAGRFYGTTGNPQQAALLIATSLPAMCYFIARPGESKLIRLALCAAAGFLSIFLIWTGSRTGMAMAAIGIALLFRARLGRFVGVALFTGIFVLLAVQIYAESTAAFSEMFVRGDTRSRVWSTMYNQFLQDPLWGATLQVYSVSENSYLAVASLAGLFGLVPLLVAIGIAGWGLLKLQRARKGLGEHMMLADLVTASLVAIALAAVFEGYLLGTLTFQVFCVYIYLGLMKFLLDAASATSAVDPAGSAYDAEDFSEAALVEQVEANGYAHSV